VTAETPEEAPRPRCIWWSDPSDDFYGRCIHDAPHGGPHLNEHGVGWYGERWDHNTAQEPKPAPGPAELQFLLDNERTERLHRAGERDEARSDLRRMHRLALDVLATLPDGSVRARRWRERADAIIGRHSQPEPAPRADSDRLLDWAARLIVAAAEGADVSSGGWRTEQRDWLSAFSATPPAPPAPDARRALLDIIDAEGGG
jgi:hypothetical protein